MRIPALFFRSKASNNYNTSVKTEAKKPDENKEIDKSDKSDKKTKLEKKELVPAAAMSASKNTITIKIEDFKYLQHLLKESGKKSESLTPIFNFFHQLNYSTKEIKSLINLSFDLVSQDKERTALFKGATILWVALSSIQIDKIEKLLMAGANPNKKVVMCTQISVNNSIFFWLFTFMNNYNSKPDRKFIYHDFKLLCELFLKHGASPFDSEDGLHIFLYFLDESLIHDREHYMPYLIYALCEHFKKDINSPFLRKHYKFIEDILSDPSRNPNLLVYAKPLKMFINQIQLHKKILIDEINYTRDVAGIVQSYLNFATDDDETLTYLSNNLKKFAETYNIDSGKLKRTINVTASLEEKAKSILSIIKTIDDIVTQPISSSTVFSKEKHCIRYKNWQTFKEIHAEFIEAANKIVKNNEELSIEKISLDFA